MAAEIDVQNQIDTNETEYEFKPGRPRSEKSRKAILDATRRLMTHSSLGELSIEAIAKKAKVGKTTIYRWWPNKASVAMEAFLEQPGVQNIMPTSASPTETIKKQIENLIRQLKGQNGRIIAGIIAESQSDASVLDLIYDKFLKDRVGTLYTQFDLGQKSGEFNTELDSDIAIDMIMGPLFLRVLSGENALDNSFAERYPTQALSMLRA
jgi:AcrR family transcriptional regulator